MTTNARARNASAGFTLVEMLAIIAILCILASLLMPTLHKAVETSRQTACGGNLRQIGQAVQSYADNSNGFLIPVSLTGKDIAWGFWHNRLISLRYVPDRWGFTCPSSINAGKIATTQSTFDWFVLFGFNLGMNTGKSIGAQKQPSLKMLLMDSGCESSGSCALSLGYFRMALSSPTPGTGMPAGRHANICNVLCLDGHSESPYIPDVLHPLQNSPFRYYNAKDAPRLKW